MKRYIVFLKQVPLSTKVDLDPVTKTLKRSSALSQTNPDDLYALQMALDLKRQSGAEVIAVSMGPASLLEAEVPNMGTEVKGVVEALYTAPRWMVQAEYYFDRLNRTDGRKAYRPHGGYIQGGFLLKGRGFEYDAMYGIPSRPATPQAIELVARLNYTDMNDNRAGIYGGEETDLSLGVNWYINQYLGVKLNGSYVWVGEHCNAFYKKDFFLAQLRLQYIF